LNTYECMYIIQANLSDDENDKANRRVVEEIEKRGGAILSRDRLGKKRLAYRIRNHDDGVYYLMYFELPPGEVAAVRGAYRMHPRLLRFLILRKAREDVPKLQKRTPPAPEPTESAPESSAQDKQAPAEPPVVQDTVGTAADEAPGKELSEEAGVAPEPTTQE